MNNKPIAQRILRQMLSPEGEPVGEPILQSQTSFDRTHFKPLREQTSDASGAPGPVTEYSYNEQGFLTEEKLFEPDGELIERRSWEPDEKQRILRAFTHYADGSFDVCRYIYDDNDRITEKITEDSEGEPEEREVFNWQQDRLIHEARYDGEGELLSESTYEYDDQGRLISHHINNPEEASGLEKNYEYNQAGHQTRVLTYDQEGELIARVILTPDEKGRPVEIIDEDRRKKNRSLVKYNDQDQVVFQEEYDLNGKLLSRVTREYDQQGRMLRSRVELSNPLSGFSQHYLVIHEFDFE